MKKFILLFLFFALYSISLFAQADSVKAREWQEKIMVNKNTYIGSPLNFLINDLPAGSHFTRLSHQERRSNISMSYGSDIIYLPGNPSTYAIWFQLLKPAETLPTDLLYNVPNDDPEATLRKLLGERIVTDLHAVTLIPPR